MPRAPAAPPRPRCSAGRGSEQLKTAVSGANETPSTEYHGLQNHSFQNKKKYSSTTWKLGRNHCAYAVTQMTPLLLALSPSRAARQAGPQESRAEAQRQSGTPVNSPLTRGRSHQFERKGPTQVPTIARCGRPSRRVASCSAINCRHRPRRRARERQRHLLWEKNEGKKVYVKCRRA